MYSWEQSSHLDGAGLVLLTIWLAIHDERCGPVPFGSAEVDILWYHRCRLILETRCRGDVSM